MFNKIILERVISAYNFARNNYAIIFPLQTFSYYFRKLKIFL